MINAITDFSRVDYVGKLYQPKGDFVDERHRHRYEVNPDYIHLFEEKGFMFVGQDMEGLRMEIMELYGTGRLVK